MENAENIARRSIMSNTIAARTLIVGGGTSPGIARLQDIAKRFDMVIAADVGLAHLREAGIIPAHVIGDFDSASQDMLEKIPQNRRIHDLSQDDTDLEKAIRFSLDLGVREIGLACVTGSRIDHTFNAVSLMVRYEDRVPVTLYDTHGDAALVNPPGIDISGNKGEKISLSPAPGATGLRSVGLLYPLNGLKIGFGERDGIANELTEDTALITFDTGRLLLYRQRPLLPL